MLRTIIQNLVGLPPLAVFVYLLILGLPRSGFLHPGFWILLGLCIFWFYLFTMEGLLLLYGLLKFDYATRVEKELNECLKDLLKTLDNVRIDYSIRRIIRARVVKTNHGNILLIGLLCSAGPSIVREYSVMFYPRHLLETVMKSI